LADLRIEKGIGVGAELMYARIVGKPVIGWVPTNSYYKRDRIDDLFGEDVINWIHPFAYGLCDLIVEDLEEACYHVNRMSEEKGFYQNTTKAPDEAIRAFKAAYGERADF
jgi:hypothetical protein